MTVSMIAAVSENNVIGIRNRLPWHLPADLRHFRARTMGHHVIMGRKTFDSIGKPLKNRTNIVITRQTDFRAEGCLVASSPDEALRMVRNDQEAFIVGGAEIYRIGMKIAERLYITRVHQCFEGDAVFPDIPENKWVVTERSDHSADGENRYGYSFITYERRKNGK